MNNSFLKFVQEAMRVRRLLKPSDYGRWWWGVVRTMPAILRTKSLAPADEIFGGAFSYRHAGKLIHVENTSLGIIREIVGDECYVARKDLAECREVLDLGANTGMFTLFALSSEPDVRVHSVEAQRDFIPKIQRNLAGNGFASRASVENALVGGAHDAWARALRMQQPELPDFDVRRYLDRVGNCDLLKCDVEGAEYVLFDGDLGWTRQVSRISLEYHGQWADGKLLADRLQQQGFAVSQRTHGVLGYVNARRKGSR